VVDFNLAFFSSSSENVTVKTLLKSVHIHQKLLQEKFGAVFLATLYITHICTDNNVDYCNTDFTRTDGCIENNYRSTGGLEND